MRYGELQSYGAELPDAGKYFRARQVYLYISVLSLSGWNFYHYAQ